MKSYIRLTLLITLTALATSILSGATSKYRLSVRDNGATSMVIGWSDDDADVAYGTVDHGTNFNSYSNTVSAAQTVDKSEKGLNHHFARLTGLTPNTVYYFVIKAGTHLSPRMSFKTLPSGSGFTMVTGGDSRSNRGVRQDGNRLVAKLRPQAVVFCGDFTNSNSDAEWNEWLDDWQLTRSSDGRMMPIVPVLGNHEGYTPSNIIDIFDAKAAYFTVELGDMVVASLVSNGDMVAQANWLQSELTNHMDKRWRVVSYHKPMRVHSTAKGDDNAIYNAWAQLFYDYKVQLSVDGDTHLSKTTWPIRPDPGGEDGFVRDDENGTVFCGEGSWGAPLRPYDNAKSWTRKGGSFAQFKWINVLGTKMVLRTVKFENVGNVGTVSDNDPYALPSGIVLHGGDIDVTGGQPPPNNSQLISQSIPSAMLPGSTQEITITMKNTGEDTWSPSSGHKLGTNNPMDNTTWTGSARVQLEHDVLPGQEYTFTIPITAPSTPGTYDIMFRMVDDVQPEQGWFGPTTNNVAVAVASSGSGSTDSISVNASDDAEEKADGTITETSSDLEFMTDGGQVQTIAVRFASVNIPNSATVTNAYIQFTGDSSAGAGDGNAMNITIKGHETANSPVTNGNNGDVTGRTNLTNTSASWSPPAWTSTNGVNERTTNLASIIEEIRADTSWSQGNPLTFIFSGSGGTRRAESVNGDAGEQPVLHVTYSTTIENYVPAWSGSKISKTVAPGSGALSESLTGDVSDDDPLTFSKVSYVGGPGDDWLTVGSNGSLSGTVPSYAGVYSWIVSADDPSHAPVETILEIAVVGAGNNTPVVTSIPVTGVVEEADYEYTITASDLDGDSLTFSAGTVPAWLSFNSGARYLSGTPSSSDVGTHVVSIDIDDGNAVTAHTFNVEVFDTPLPANLVQNGSFEQGGASPTSWTINGAVGTTENSQSGSSSLKKVNGATAEQTVTLQANTDYNISVWINASGMTGGTAVFDTNDVFDASGQGQFVLYSANSGWEQFSGTFNSGAVTSVKLRIFGGTVTGNVYYDDVVISPVGAGASTAPVITSIPVTTVDYNSAYSYQLTAADVNGDNLTFHGDTVPGWLNFNETTGLLSGGSGTTNAGPHSVSIRVSDGSLEDIQNFTITVAAPPNVAPTWNSGTIAKVNAVDGEAYAGSLASDANDGDGDSLTFAKVSGASWLTVGSNGNLSGTPSTGNIGLNTFTVSVTDSNSAPVQVTLQITVEAAPDPYVAWAANNSLPVGQDGTDDDPDGDGIVNLVEFALAGDPQAVDGDANLPTVTSNASTINFTFNRAEADVTYTVESSTDLQNWTVEAIDPGSIGGDVTVPVANSGKVFLRLRVDN